MNEINNNEITTINDLEAELLDVSKIDLNSTATSNQQKIQVIKQIASVFQRAGNLKIKENAQRNISHILRDKLSIKGSEELAPYVDDNRTPNELANKKGNLALPMNMLQNLVNDKTDNFTFNIAISYITQNEGNSILNNWLKNQEEVTEFSEEYQKSVDEKMPEVLEAKELEQQDKLAKQKRKDAEYFETVDDALLELAEVKPCFLEKEYTSREDALRFCKEVMAIIVKCEHLKFNESQRREFSEILKTLGAATFQTANLKFIGNSDVQTLDELVNSKTNLGLPISTFTQLIDTDETTFETGLSKLTEGGLEDSYIGQWLGTKEKKKETTLN